MAPGTIALLSLSMSTDAFAAAVGRGAAKQPGWRSVIKAAAVFGLVEGVTPVLGWGVGVIAAGFVERVDHWIAFTLLAIVGGKMIYSSFSTPDQASERPQKPRNQRRLELFATAIGTSIDAAAVGVGLAFIGANIWVIAACIGFTTFVTTTVGMTLGRRIGVRFGKWAELVAGIVLIGIGSTILYEHLTA